MGKKRQLIHYPQKYGCKHHAHPALAASTDEAPAPTTLAQKADPEPKKKNIFKKLAKKAKTKAPDTE